VLDRNVEGIERLPRKRAAALVGERVGWLREAIPELVLRTTVIVGFPGETEEEFEEMLDLLREIRFERVGAFAYSIEEGTPAATMDGHIDEDEKRARLERVMDLQREIASEKNEELIGRRELLLVDRILDDDPDFAAEGRVRSQAVDVDGITRLLPSVGGEFVPGTFVEVEIVDSEEYDLMAKVIG
jgi:ribosomal protein S12 methylthiotransferase